MSPTPTLPSAATPAVRGPVQLSELLPVLEWMRQRTGLAFPRAHRPHALRAAREPALLDALCAARSTLSATT